MCLMHHVDPPPLESPENIVAQVTRIPPCERRVRWRIRSNSQDAASGRHLRLLLRRMNRGRAETVDATEIAARNVVYGLSDATAGEPVRWATLRRMNEYRAAIARAIERGWVILWGTSGEPLELKVALTDKGRRLARRGR